MTAQDIQTSVLVIGGGPAGSTAAAMLARQGVEVTLLERERFPRDHVGESLLPASMPVLEELGVLCAVQEAGFVPKFGATMSWGRDRTPWSWYFGETNAKYPHSYQVWRPLFDQILLENSRSLGVDVREGHRVVEVIWDGKRAAGVRFRTEDGHTGSVRVDFVVDASGQAGLLSRSLDLRRWDTFFSKPGSVWILHRRPSASGSRRRQHLHRVLRARLALDYPPEQRLEQRWRSGRQ